MKNKKEKPLKITGTLEDVIRIAVGDNPAPKPKNRKKKSKW